jgi:hypothetical protein
MNTNDCRKLRPNRYFRRSAVSIPANYVMAGRAVSLNDFTDSWRQLPG